MVKTSISERSPLLPTASTRKGFVWWQSLLLALALVVVGFLSFVLVLILMIAFGLVTRSELSPNHFSWALFDLQMGAYVIPYVGMLYALPWLANRSLADLGLRAPRASDLGWGLAGAIVMFVVADGSGVLETALFHVKPDEMQVHWLRELHGSLEVAFVVLACIAAPVFEELIFRGFVFNAILRYTPLWLAVVLSSALFGLAHGIGQPGNSGALFPLAASGAVLALVYSYSRSLVASMITHAAFNSITVVLVIALHQT